MGRRLIIDRAAVLATGLAIADDCGLEAVTMQAVADRLAVTPMALYRHVANKADLLDGLVELLLTEFPLPPQQLGWRQRLRALAVAIRRSARRHPAIFPLLLQRPAVTPEAVRVRDAICVALQDAGMTADRAAQAERLISTAVLGFAVSEVAGRFARHPRRVIDDDFDQLVQLLEGFIDASVR